MTVEEPVIELRSGAGTGSEGTTSPKVSSVGSGREGKRPVDLPQVVDAGAPGLDTHHWAGVRRGPRDGDTRSIASSMAAEKDALSVYDNQEYELDSEARDEDTKIAQAAEDDLGLGQGATLLATEPSVMEEEQVVLSPGSSISGLPARGEAEDGTDDAASVGTGPASPRGASRLRESVLRADEPGGDLSGEAAELEAERADTQAQAGSLQDAEEVPPPEAGAEVDVQGSSRAGEGSHSGEPAPRADAGGGDGARREAGGVTTAGPSAEEADAASSGADGAAPPATPGPAPAPAAALTEDDSSPSSEASHEYAANESAIVRLKHSLQAEPSADSPATLAEQGRAMLSLTTAGGAPAPAAAAASQGPGNEAEAEEEEEIEDLTIYRSGEGAGGVPQHGEAGGVPPTSAPPKVEAASFSMEAGPDSGAAAVPAPPSPVVLPEEFNPAWEETFRGLVYADGVDSLGRPVVVLDADRVPAGMKSSAARYVTAHLARLVEGGDYVLVLTARRATLPSMWIMGAYTTLPRPFRKNVKVIVLVRPAGFLRAVLALLRPLLSAKAARKLRQVASLAQIGEATGGEVGVEHLGAAFLASDAAREELGELAAAARGEA
ncbi:hypothetical protein ACKKBF_B20215 [Auxenochlorella protothecoides x Auxenochlorella symbiontica]